eukprot:755786-Alexandrium_andersonii.AAC.1
MPVTAKKTFGTSPPQLSLPAHAFVGTAKLHDSAPTSAGRAPWAPHAAQCRWPSSPRTWSLAARGPRS